MSDLFGRASKVLLAAGLATALGCAPTTYSSYHGHFHHHHGGSGAGLLVAGVIAGVAVASLAAEAERPPPSTAVYVYSAPPSVVIATPAPAAPPPPRADDLPPLDPTATRAAFESVDLSACHAPTVYGHAKISLNPDGHISRVVVEDPPDLDPQVAQCIGREIGSVTTPKFRGGMVMLGITFRTP